MFSVRYGLQPTNSCRWKQCSLWGTDWRLRNNRLSKHLAFYETYFHTYLLTPWIRVLLEKLTGLQLVKEFPAFCGTRRFIIGITSARYLSLSWASSIQSIPPNPTSLRSISILSSIYAWVSPVVFFPLDSPPNPCTRLFPPPHALHAPPNSFFSILSPEKYWVSSTEY